MNDQIDPLFELAVSLTDEQQTMWAAIVDYQALRRRMDPVHLARLDSQPSNGAPTYMTLVGRFQEGLTPRQRQLQAELFGWG
jgi:hypothetical protein